MSRKMRYGSEESKFNGLWLLIIVGVVVTSANLMYHRSRALEKAAIGDVKNTKVVSPNLHNYTKDDKNFIITTVLGGNNERKKE